MTTHIAFLDTGLAVEVNRVDVDPYFNDAGFRKNYKYFDANGVEVNPISTADLRFITKDEIDFEAELSRFTMRANFAKHENLLYKDEFIRAVYNTWRSAKGLDLNDPGYINTQTNPAQSQQPEYYKSNRKQYAGD